MENKWTVDSGQKKKTKRTEGRVWSTGRVCGGISGTHRGGSRMKSCSFTEFPLIGGICRCVFMSFASMQCKVRRDSSAFGGNNFLSNGS